MYEDSYYALNHQPTLCEVTYQQLGWLGGGSTPAEEVPPVPYRYPSWTSGPTQGSGYKLATQPACPTAASFYQMYDPMTVGCRTPMSYASPGRPCTTFSFYRNSLTGAPSRAYTLPPNHYNQDSFHDATAGHGGRAEGTGLKNKKSRAKTAPTCASLPILKGPSQMSNYSHQHLPSTEEAEEKLKWVPSLNSWVAEKGQSPAPYLCFVNSMSVLGRSGQSESGDDDDFPVLPCSRYLTHMHMHDEADQAQHARDHARLEQQRQRRERFDASKHKLRPQPPVQQQSRVKFQLEKPTPRRRKRSPARPVQVEKPDSSGEGDVETEWEQQSRGSGDGLSQDGVDKEGDGSSANGAAGDGTDNGLSEAEDAGQDGDSSQHSEEAPPKSPSPPPTPPSPITVPDAGSVHTDTTPSSVPKKLKPQPSPAKSSKAKSQRKPKPAKPPTERKRRKKPSKSGEEVGRHPPVELDITIKSEDQESRGSNSPAPQPLRTDVEKRVRWRAQPKAKEKPPSPGPQRPNFQNRSGGNWIFDGEDFSTQMSKEEKQGGEGDHIKAPTPPTPKTPTPPGSADKQKRTKAADLPKVLPDWAKRRWGTKKLDKSWEEEQRRQQLAEERRKKAMLMMEKLKQKGYAEEDDNDPKMPRFEDYGWLAQYCILNKGTLDMYRHAFMAFDEEERGWLSPTDTIMALRAVNRSLMSESEEIYMYRILEITGYSVTEGSDLKLFAILAALSHKIASLDGWMKTEIGKMDFEMLDMKSFMCKTLWECNVEEDSKKISIDQLCVELRAGGVSFEHENEVREKLGHLLALDLLDFLTYVPLFIMIHNSVVSNPLDDSRVK